MPNAQYTKKRKTSNCFAAKDTHQCACRRATPFSYIAGELRKRKVYALKVNYKDESVVVYQVCSGRYKTSRPDAMPSGANVSYETLMWSRGYIFDKSTRGAYIVYSFTWNMVIPGRVSYETIFKDVFGGVFVGAGCFFAVFRLFFCENLWREDKNLLSCQFFGQNSCLFSPFMVW